MATGRRPFFCGNWKLNGSIAESLALATDVRNGVATLRDVDVAVSPSFTALYAVAKRRFADEARRRGRERRLAAMLPRRSSSDYVPVAGALREALAALPGGQSQVVLLKLIRGLTFAEIGVEVGLTEAAAKMRFVRALEQLRADLSERGIEP